MHAVYSVQYYSTAYKAQMYSKPSYRIKALGFTQQGNAISQTVAFAVMSPILQLYLSLIFQRSFAANRAVICAGLAL